MTSQTKSHDGEAEGGDALEEVRRKHKLWWIGDEWRMLAWCCKEQGCGLKGDRASDGGEKLRWLFPACLWSVEGRWRC